MHAPFSIYRSQLQRDLRYRLAKRRQPTPDSSQRFKLIETPLIQTLPLSSLTAYFAFMTSRSASAFLFCLLTTLAFTACSEESPPQSSGSEDLATIAFANATVHSEVALDRQSQQRGLMFRKELAENGGMLFVYDRPTQMSFWMRNTSIPLDIGFFTEDGVLREVYPLYPFNENSVKSRRNDLLYALEVNQGWFAKNKVRPGDKMDMQKLNEFLYP